jgi:hypothetical protein
MSTETGEVQRPLAITLVAGLIAAVAMTVVAVPWTHYTEMDARYGAIFALFGLGLAVLAAGVLQWEWLWEAWRAALLAAAVWALLGDALGFPLGPVHSPEKTAAALAGLALGLLLGRVPVSEYYARQAEHTAQGRSIHPWSEGEALLIGGFLLVTAVIVGKIATGFCVLASHVDYSLAMLGIAAYGMWLVGCARVAFAKGYPEWLGVALSVLGPVAYVALMIMPLRPARAEA